MDVQWDADMSVEEMVNEGVRRAYTWEGNTLRASVLADPAGKRQTPKTTPPPSST
ncbi:fumarate hydratase [Neisseria gonorrhoeae]|nr:fumarate hydratase [Neisseria gonorrhoeae]